MIFSIVSILPQAGAINGELNPLTVKGIKDPKSREVKNSLAILFNSLDFKGLPIGLPGLGMTWGGSTGVVPGQTALA